MARERGIRFVSDGIASGRLTPRVARTFPLPEVVAAYRSMESNEQVGKIVLTV